MAALIQLTPGMVVGGDFRVVELLSAGGMGAVYIAEQQSTGKRRAVKVMHPQLVADPKLRERFEQEARVGALIASDHVVEVIAAGVESSSGMPWIAMELLEGEDLATHVQRHGIPSTERLREMVQQLCHALGAAHAAGVVHRDLKPENVFLSKARTANGRPSIKVLDFGIAKVVARARTTATAAIGTPAWMSPEQTDPRAGISPATDVWALGLIVYWLMTGRPYWISAGDPTSSMHAVMREILFEPMATASARAGERGAAERLPPGFDAWFERCVTREPKARFATATELLGSFEQLCNGFNADAVGPPASIEGSLGSETSPLSTRSYLAAAEMRAGPSSTEDKTELAPSGPTGSAFVASSPTADDAGDRHETIAARPRSTRRNMALGMGIGLLAAAGAVFMVRDMTTRGPAPSTTLAPITASSAPDEPLLVAPRDTAPEAIPSASAQAIPSASSSSLPIATAARERPTASGRKPLAPARPGPDDSADAGAAEPAPEAKKPFNLAHAQRVLENRATVARFACKNRAGPKAIGGTVFFSPSGQAQRIEGDVQSYGTQTGFCVKSHLLSAYIGPFEGESQGVPVAVVLQ